MKKIISKFIYPYRHLHKKWWHRLILVLLIIISLTTTIAVAVDVESFSYSFFEEKIYITGGSSTYPFNNDIACENDSSYLSWSSLDGCDSVDVFNFLTESEWAKFQENSSGLTFNEFINKNPVYKIFMNDMDKTRVVGSLVDNGIIDLNYEYNFIVTNLLMVVLLSILSGVGVFVAFFSVIYRIVLYIVYGTGLGK